MGRCSLASDPRPIRYQLSPSLGVVRVAEPRGRPLPLPWVSLREWGQECRVTSCPLSVGRGQSWPLGTGLSLLALGAAPTCCWSPGTAIERGRGRCSPIRHTLRPQASTGHQDQLDPRPSTATSRDLRHTCGASGGISLTPFLCPGLPGVQFNLTFLYETASGRGSCPLCPSPQGAPVSGPGPCHFASLAQHLDSSPPFPQRKGGGGSGWEGEGTDGVLGGLNPVTLGTADSAHKSQPQAGREHVSPACGCGRCGEGPSDPRPGQAVGGGASLHSPSLTRLRLLHFVSHSHYAPHSWFQVPPTQDTSPTSPHSAASPTIMNPQILVPLSRPYVQVTRVTPSASMSLFPPTTARPQVPTLGSVVAEGSSSEERVPGVWGRVSGAWSCAETPLPAGLGVGTHPRLTMRRSDSKLPW